MAERRLVAVQRAELAVEHEHQRSITVYKGANYVITGNTNPSDENAIKKIEIQQKTEEETTIEKIYEIIIKKYEDPADDDMIPQQDLVLRFTEKMEKSRKETILVNDTLFMITTKTDAEIKEITARISESDIVDIDMATYEFTNSIVIKNEGQPGPGVVKLGRTYVKFLSPLAHHWAVQIDNTWYEIDRKNKETRKNSVKVSHGRRAESGAGTCGGEVVGLSTKTEKDVKEWIDRWTFSFPEYDLLNDNCQKFAYDFMNWATCGNFLCEHRVNAANIKLGDIDENQVDNTKGFKAEKDGNLVAHLKFGKDILTSCGPCSTRCKLGHLTFQMVAGPGLGIFFDAILADVCVSSGNLVGAHLGLNLNTGLGIRNGNFEAQLLGFGGKIGFDGVEVNFLVGGMNACSLM